VLHDTPLCTLYAFFSRSLRHCPLDNAAGSLRRRRWLGWWSHSGVARVDGDRGHGRVGAVVIDGDRARAVIHKEPTPNSAPTKRRPRRRHRQHARQRRHLARACTASASTTSCR
jgi:hypothetical protein